MNEEITLKSAVSLLMRLKQSLEHRRRFGSDTLNDHRRTCTQTEGDIEEWLIDNGFLKYPHSF